MAGAKRRDKYPNFEMLRRAERADDFRIDCRIHPSSRAFAMAAAKPLARRTFRKRYPYSVCA
jgi:hypothetical protein